MHLYKFFKLVHNNAGTPLYKFSSLAMAYRTFSDGIVLLWSHNFTCKVSHLLLKHSFLNLPSFQNYHQNLHELANACLG